MSFGRKTPEEIAEKGARKEARQDAKERLAYLEGPAGSARTAYQRGDRLYQCCIKVMSQNVNYSLKLALTTKTPSDPNIALNAICDEGWDLVSGSFVFVEENLMTPSSNGGTFEGKTMGYYLFRRSESSWRADAPWRD